MAAAYLFHAAALFLVLPVKTRTNRNSPDISSNAACLCIWLSSSKTNIVVMHRRHGDYLQCVYDSTRVLLDRNLGCSVEQNTHQTNSRRRQKGTSSHLTSQRMCIPKANLRSHICASLHWSLARRSFRPLMDVLLYSIILQDIELGCCTFHRIGRASEKEQCADEGAVQLLSRWQRSSL